MGKADIGVVGLAVMGSNLARNLESRQLTVSVYNRTPNVTDQFMGEFGEGNFIASKSMEEFLASLQSPRKIILMVKAGDAVDLILEQVLPLLSPGDIIADGGNAYYRDTQRRVAFCAQRGIHFLGIGISGGEEGALHGPSIMPGGDIDAWREVAPILDLVSARADGPCTAYMGPDGAGHFVKMVHNGIEYGDMQLIAEAYHILQEGSGLGPAEIADVFERWNEGKLSSYLMEISSSILRRKDDLTEGFLVDQVLDQAGQKGTGRWTVQLALEFGVSIPTISSSVDARVLSSLKTFRQQLAGIFPQARNGKRLSSDIVAELEDGLFIAKALCYAQGFDLLREAARVEKWNLNLAEVARIWKGGCIIRARFLDQIQFAFEQDPELSHLILAPSLKEEVVAKLPVLRKIVSVAADLGIPAPSFMSSLFYLESLLRAELPQNLTQAQRDYFGAHTYQRKDRQGVFHSEWESLPLQRTSRS